MRSVLLFPFCREAAEALRVYTLLPWVIWQVSDTVEFASKFKYLKSICSFPFPLLKFAKCYCFSLPHQTLIGIWWELVFYCLWRFHAVLSLKKNWHNALFLSMNHICIALRMLRTQFSPGNPLFLSFCMFIIEISGMIVLSMPMLFNRRVTQATNVSHRWN